VHSYVLPQVGVAEAGVVTGGRWRDDEGSGDQKTTNHSYPSTTGCRSELDLAGFEPAGCQNSITGPDLGFYAARSYSLMRPPRTGRRLDSLLREVGGRVVGPRHATRQHLCRSEAI
jgi:hypothetical protein